jgi:hypothetical protein
VATSIDPFKKRELTDRVTGKGPPAPPPAAPASKLPPGVTGTLPLPTGKAMVGSAGVGIDPRHMTPTERATLEAIGWDDTMPIPRNMADLIEAATKTQLDAPVPLPVDPRTPPIKVNTVNLEDLPEAKQKELLAAMRASFETEKTMADAKVAQSEAAIREMVSPGVEGARGAVDQAVKAFQEKVRADAEEPFVTVADGGQKPAAAPAPAPAPVTKSDTGADAHPADCPHCGWDLASPTSPSRPYAEKMAFLHCMLGGKPYRKEVPAVRRPAARHVPDADRPRDRHRATSRRTRTARPARPRPSWTTGSTSTATACCSSSRSSGPTGPATFFQDLPDGYSKTTNPDCDRVLGRPRAGGRARAGPSGLPAIEDWIVDNVLKTEAVIRVVNTACRDFNRLVARMEAMADNSDFWNPTGAQS